MSDGRFKKGRAKTSGRKAGTPNEHSNAVKNALRGALDNSHDDGAEGYFLKLSVDDPKTFVGAIRVLMSTTVEATVEHNNTVTVRRYSSGRDSSGSKKKAITQKKATGKKKAGSRSA